MKPQPPVMRHFLRASGLAATFALAGAPLLVRRRERLHRVDDALAHRLRHPPADGQADELVGEAVELREQRHEARDARVDVVALVDGGDHHAARLHVLEEARAPRRRHADRVQPPRARSARWRAARAA